VLTGVTAGGSATITATSGAISGQASVHVARSRLSFFWNDEVLPVGEEFPDAEYRYATVGGTPTVSRQGAGTYTAAFPGSDRTTYETEAYFVAPYAAPSGAYCRVGAWSDAAVTVRCLDAAGTPADMLWTVAMVGSTALSGRWGYAWIPSGGSSGPGSHGYRFNASGGEITSTRTAVGSYTVRFAGLGRKTATDREGVMVSSYGNAQVTECRPTTWTTVGADLDVEVRCHTPGGELEDSRFTILVVDGPRAGANLAFAHADQPGTASYTPANSAVRGTGSATVVRSNTGEYEVRFQGFHRPVGLTETYLVTATGNGQHRCQNAGWGSTSSPAGTAVIEVRCTTIAGVPVDTPFSIIGLQ
jgi:hypothetical protein